MSADLAFRLGGSVRVADPFLVARALGERARRNERNDIVELARAVGARTVLVGYVGHDRAQRMTVTIEKLTLDSANPSVVASEARKDWRDVPFTHADPPFAVFHEMLPSVIADLGLTNAERTASQRPVRIPNEASFSFAELAEEGSGLSGSVALDLLGALGGSTDEVTSDRLFARALITSWNYDVSNAEAIIARAYALLGLDHRPAALALLEGVSGPEAAVLRALLNGNAAEAQAALTSVDNPLMRLMLAVQLDDLRTALDSEAEPLAGAADAFGVLGLDWRVLVHSRVQDRNEWRSDEPAALKYLLDLVFPVEGLGAGSVVGGSIVVGKPADDVSVSLATVQHVSRFIESAPVPACCSAESARPTAWDLVGLLEGRNIAQIVKSLHRTVGMQVALERAGQDLARYFEVLDGHPLLAVQRMDYAWRLAGRVGDASMERWRNQAFEDAVLTGYYAGGQSRAANRAIGVLGFDNPHASTFLDAYGFDYPRRAFWAEWVFQNPRTADRYAKDIDALRREAAAYTRYDFTPFNRLVIAAATPDEKASLAAELRGRFVGTPGQKFLLDKLGGTQTTITDPVEALRAQLASAPDSWGVRFDLGSLIVERGGKYEEAAEIFLAHPPFQQESVSNRVLLGNYASEAGNFFFWNGREDLSVPFFEISAGLRTGSESMMSANIRLDILAGRYAEAADASLGRARRYPGAYPYRDYLSFLHAFGYDEAAWEGFSQVASSFDNAQAWVAALVGHRREGSSEAQIREWLKKPGIRDARFRGNRFALRYAVLVNASDHEPPRDLGALVEELEGEPVAWIDSEGYLARPHPQDPTGIEVLPPSSFAAGAPSPAEGTRVKSEFAYFGAAYASIQHGELDAAVEELVEMAARYPIETAEYSYVLPYLAWAAAKTGDEIEFERYVMANGGYDVRFDTFLARAFFAAVKAKDPVLARDLLVRALPRHPYTDNRPVLIEYQYAQACEWLFRETRDEAFRDLLLAWVKSQQAVQPTHAWPYAMEYVYARDAERRLRALAMTLYLDPASPRIAPATAAERRAAAVWGEKHNPFLPESSSGELEETESIAWSAPTAVR